MSEFHDVRFPLHLAFGTSGGPHRPIEILDLVNGTEVRNAKMRHSRRRYNAIAGLKSKAEAIELLSFFESRMGALHGFRFRDPLDNASADTVTTTDQTIGIGDGVRTKFSLIKTYGDAPYGYDRPITKPVIGSVLVAADGVQMAVTTDHDRGQISFENPPDIGAIITAGFKFDVPVRFASDSLDVVLDDFGAAQIQDIPLIEIIQPTDAAHE